MSPRTLYYRTLPPFPRMRRPGGVVARIIALLGATMVTAFAFGVTLLFAIPLFLLSGLLFLVALLLGRARLWRIRRRFSSRAGFGSVFMTANLRGSAMERESSSHPPEATIVEVETIDKRIER